MENCFLSPPPPPRRRGKWAKKEEEEEGQLAHLRRTEDADGTFLFSPPHIFPFSRRGARWEEGEIYDFPPHSSSPLFHYVRLL